MAEKKEYVKLWLSYACYFEPYSDAEVGRLVRAMMRYKSSGEEPGFSGNERYVWPAIKRDIDEASAAQETAAGTARENGRKGGRPKKGNPEKPKKPDGFPENPEKLWTKDKDKGQGQGQGGTFAPARVNAPTIEQVLEVAKLRGCPEYARPFFDYYDAAGWRDSEGKPVYNWQQKFVAWQLREERRKSTRTAPAANAGSFAQLAREMEEKQYDA